MFIFKDDKLFVRDGSLDHPRPGAALRCSLDLPAAWQDLPAWCEAGEDFTPEGGELIGLRQVWRQFGDGDFARAGAAWQIVNWFREARFCSRCGHEGLVPSEKDHGLSCPSCGGTFYAPLSPAIIVAVERDFGGEKRLLLAHNTGMPEGRLSVLAGFMEPGETLEEAVAREVREEVSVEVQDVRYFGSQPWPFPHSLMLGFTARWRAGELRPDGLEIGTAGWFAPAEILDGNIPDRASISRRLIDHFISTSGGPGNAVGS